MEKVLKILTDPCPLVSVIIPVFNGSLYLADAIDSVLSQTYTNIEIIVVNDGSDDNGLTEKVALSYEDKIRYFYKKNGGVSSALNLGLSKMRGDFFSWLSHDDVYRESKIFLQVEYMLKHPEISLVYGNYELQNEMGNPFFCVTPNRDFPSIYSLYHLFRRQTNICSALIRKEVFKQIGPFNEASLTTQDYEFLFHCFTSLKCAYMNVTFVNTRIHPEQGSQTIKNHVKNAEKMWISFFSSLSDDWYRKLGGRDNFLLHSINYFKKTPYLEVASFCDEMISNSANKKNAEKISFFLICREELHNFKDLHNFNLQRDKKNNSYPTIFFWTKSEAVLNEYKQEETIKLVQAESFEELINVLVQKFPIYSYVNFVSKNRPCSEKKIVEMIRKSEAELSFTCIFTDKKSLNLLDVEWNNILVRLDYLNEARDFCQTPQNLLFRLEEISKVSYVNFNKQSRLGLRFSEERLHFFAAKLFCSNILKTRKELAEALIAYLFYTNIASKKKKFSHRLLNIIKRLWSTSGLRLLKDRLSLLYKKNF